MLWSCRPKVLSDQPIKKNLLLDTAYYLLDEGKEDSAFLYFDRSKQYSLEHDDSLGVAISLINMAVTQRGQS